MTHEANQKLLINSFAIGFAFLFCFKLSTVIVSEMFASVEKREFLPNIKGIL